MNHDRTSTIELAQSDLIFLHSPLNLLAQFVLLLEERFSHGNLPWSHSPDENQTKIFIHTEYNAPKEVGDAYPRISVGRGSVVHNRDVIGDIGPDNQDLLPRGTYVHWGTGDCDLRLQCVAENRGEATILGDIVQTLIGMSRKEICKQFSLRDVSAIVLQPAQPYTRDKEKWMCSVEFRVNFEHRWVTLVTAPTLKGINVYSSSQLEALDYVKNIIIKSS